MENLFFYGVVSAASIQTISCLPLHYILIGAGIFLFLTSITLTVYNTVKYTIQEEIDRVVRCMDFEVVDARPATGKCPFFQTFNLNEAVKNEAVKNEGTFVKKDNTAEETVTEAATTAAERVDSPVATQSTTAEFS